MMADEQPTTPSVAPEPTDAPASESTSTDAEPKASRPGWWGNLFRRRGDPEPEAESTESDKPDAASSKLSLTQDELDRRVQAETDRREAKRAQEAKAQARRELRDKDPWAYAEEERKAEQAAVSTQDLESFVTGIGAHHDKVSIDPIFLALPKADQERISNLEGAGRGLEGRKLVVTESLKALEKHWKAEGAKDAEAKLRRNSAFRKQLLAEARGQTVEPEILSAGSPSEADKNLSGILREYYRLG